jgi:predicted ATPase with chaperone activity
MQLAEFLMARGHVTLEGAAQAAAHQAENGGRIDDSLQALGLVTEELIAEANDYVPKAPKTVEGTGLPATSLMPLLLKFIYVEQRETPAEFMDALKLPYNIIKSLLDDLVEMKLLQSLGSGTAGGTGGVGGLAGMRYGLTERGREAASDAMKRNRYIGPAPVSLNVFQAQVLKQSIASEQIGVERVTECFSDLVVGDHFVRQIGPAINSGRAVLLYGPAGNGKTSVATRVADIFTDIIFVPYTIEIEGQIIQLYDSAVHLPADIPSLAKELPEHSKGLRRDEVDRRWFACKRPTVIVGGELTLEMLDLAYSDVSNFYEAPMHVKALNGTFIVDDFGRQLVDPGKLLNRWIVPMENRVDFFKLKTGRTIEIPFDELLIFSTNMEPRDLIDPAFLRRIPYKIELGAPTLDEYRSAFRMVAESAGMELPEDVLDFIVDRLAANEEQTLGFYQARFITDHVLAACKYLDTPPSFTRDGVVDALENLYISYHTESEAD